MYGRRGTLFSPTSDYSVGLAPPARRRPASGSGRDSSAPPSSNSPPCYRHPEASQRAANRPPRMPDERFTAATLPRPGSHGTQHVELRGIPGGALASSPQLGPGLAGRAGCRGSDP